jgi:hypothetical protein
MIVDLDAIKARCAQEAASGWQTCASVRIDTLLEIVQEVETLREWLDEAARAENLNAQDLHEERSRRDAFLKALHEELTLVEAHNLLLSTARLRELCALLAPPP